MHIAQFGSKTAIGYKPVWLAALGDLRAEQNPTAETEFSVTGHRDFGLDVWGRERSPMRVTTMNVRGQVFCTGKRTQEEWDRELKRFVGVKDWLIGYRGLSCKCGLCTPPIRCCNVCGTETSVAWFAKRARFKNTNWETTPDSRIGDADQKVTLAFDADTHWTRILQSKWSYGVPTKDLAVNPADPCAPPLVTSVAWPCKLPYCHKEQASRFYFNEPVDWMDTYCVGNWTAEGWKRAHIGGTYTFFVEGDTYPLNRWAFTNFQRLTVTICSQAGDECSFTMSSDTVSEPQYALVDSRFGAEVRYCPLSDDACMNITQPDLDMYGSIASEGAPLAIDSRTCANVGRLYPGRNLVTFSGFRMPGGLFHISYDIVPQYV